MSEVTMSRSREGVLQAETVIPLGADRRELRITTRRNSIRKSLCCEAKVVQASEDGRSWTHAFSLGVHGIGDYSRHVAEDPAARATEKSIRALHSVGVAMADRLADDARAFYAARAARTAHV